MRRTRVWVSVFRNSVIHKIFSEFLQPFRYVGIIRVSPFSIVILIVIWVLDFGWFIQQLFWYFRRIRVSRTCLYTLSLDTTAAKWSEWPISFESVVGVEVDELEEDLEWSISCLEGVLGVEGGKLEEEIPDKPGTTIDTKFSVLHCIRIPFFFMRCGFLTVDPLIWESMYIAKLS